MIVFDLQCSKGHMFEGWFEDNKAYESQKKRDLVTCPVCDDKDVSKIPSTFGMVKSSQNSPQKIKNDDQNHAMAFADLNKKMVEYVKKNFDDVGGEFTKEALKIHYGVTEPRNIRGVSTKDEENVLKEEGVQVFKIPMPPEPETDA